MNDELQGANEQLRTRSAEVTELNDFMESILSSMKSAVIVLDRQLTVQTWNKNAHDLWGVRSEEAVGTHLLSLDIGLPTEAIKPLLFKVLADPGQTEHLSTDAVNRRGRNVRLNVTVAALVSPESGPSGVLLVMDATQPD